MNDSAVVIGSNSFSGSHFAMGLLDEGFDVLGISRSAEPNRAFLPYRWNADDADGFRFSQLDLNDRTAEILDAIAEFRAEYVVNFAAQSMVAQSWDQPEDWYRTNVLANVRLHEGLRRFDFLKQYVHVSTPEVYGNCAGKVTESAPFNPSSPYATSRAACDMHLMNYHANYDFPVVFTRSANVYGPGQQVYRIIPKTILSIRKGIKLPLHGGGTSMRSFIHIRDVVSATLAVMREASPPEVFHIATERYVSIRELVEIICTTMGVAFEDVVDLADERPGKDAAYYLDSSKARQELEWSDRVSLEEGILETIEWVNSHIAELSRQPTEYIHKQ